MTRLAHTGHYDLASAVQYQVNRLLKLGSHPWNQIENRLRLIGQTLYASIYYLTHSSKGSKRGVKE